MAMGSNPSLTVSGGNPAEFGSRFGLREELGEHGDGAPVGQQALLQSGLSGRARQVQLSVEAGHEDYALNPAAGLFGFGGIPTRRIRQGQMPVSVDAIAADTISVNAQILQENFQLRLEVGKLQEVLRHSKIATADLYSKFGELAKDWAATVKELNVLHENQKQEYEEMIKSLQKTNKALLKENQEMKKVIENLNSMKTEFDKQKRLLRLAQIGYQLDKLVSEYVFPGDDKASKRARYGINLKSLRNKMENQKLQEDAKERMNKLKEEIGFEDWFLGIVKEMKKVRVDTAHPDLGTYEEMEEIIMDECKDDDDKRDDMLRALERLGKMYELLKRSFGK